MRKLKKLIKTFISHILRKCSDWKLKRIIEWEIKNKGEFWYGKCKGK